MRSRLGRLILWAAVTTMLVGVGNTPASADTFTTWDFSWDINFSTVINASGVLTLDCTSQDANPCTIVDIIRGEQDGKPITLLGFNDFNLNDNRFDRRGTNSGSPFSWVDAFGLAYREEGGDNYSFFFDGSEYKGCWSEGACVLVSNIQLMPTPEPSTMLLLGTGMLGVLASIRRKLKV